jgi:uncharacterized repeat protein (TIGR01451 family)
LHRPKSLHILAPAVLVTAALAATNPDSLPMVELPLAPPAAEANGPATLWVELDAPAAALVWAEELARGDRRDTQTMARAVGAGRSQAARNASAQDSLASQITAVAPAATEIYRVQKAANAIVIQADRADLAALRALPGVKRVEEMALEYPTNSTSVSFLGTPEVWNGIASLGLPIDADGSGISIGIIDTGIDYQHANFGGTGALADYQANDRTAAPDAFFPTAKVVGGWDFAGDAYTGGIPAPDPDPMDCNGHGTHVAGTAAGFGVNTDGTTFAGPFTPATNYGALRIGPGTAPNAELYALRVFGCGGGTSLTALAIDWAIDPNGDSDFSDHLDVINLSLGSAFGSGFSASALAADNAAAAGVVVVASAGNNGDTHFISGSPGSGSRVISVAASADSGLPGPGVRVNAPGGIAGFYVAGTPAFGNAPPPGGTTGNVVLGLDPSDPAGPLTTDGCSALTNAAAVAGNIALIDRGTCGFVVKVKNAQDAGAIAVIIANNAAAFGNMAGSDPTITIPSVMVTLADGNTFKANIASLNVTLFPASDTIGSFTSRGPRRIAPYRLKPDIAAPGVAITSAQTGVTCTGTAPFTGCSGLSNVSGFLPDSQPLVLQGTSMAAPHIAGIMALLRQLHPAWTIEELKALAMNYALEDMSVFPGGGGARYAPGRIGAGRTTPPEAALGNVLAMNADDPGLVSLSFETHLPVGTATEVKRLRLVNHGPSDRTFDLAFDIVTDAPGISFSLPGGNSVLVPAGGAVEIDVQMDANASLMDHVRDATVAATQGAPAPLTGLLGNLNRHWLTEESGWLTLSQGGNLVLRVPVYLAARPASAMAAANTIATGGAGTGSTTIALTGSDVCTGTLGAGPTCTGSFPTDEVSLVTPFELQVVSGLNPANSTDYADLQYAGTAFDGASGLVLFGLSTWGPWSTLTDVAFNICVDFDENGIYDRIVFNSNAGTMAGALFGTAGASAQDPFITSVFNTGTNGVTVGGAGTYVNRVSAAGADTAQFDNQVLFLGTTPAQLGLPGGDTTFRYKIITCPGGAPLCGRSAAGDRCSPAAGTFFDQAAGPYFWNYAAQGLDFGGGNLFFDLNGANLPVTWNTANMTTNGSLGALLLHHHNGVGNRAEVVLLEGAQAADLAITKSVDDPAPAFGDQVTFTVTVTNNGPNDAAGVFVGDFLPGGLTWVSDDSGGAYDPGLGLWTIGALANAASTTLEIIASVASTDEQCNTATVGASQAPLDPNPANNQATVCVSAPRSSDLALAMSTNVPTVLVGGNVVFTLTVENLGNDPAYGIDVTEAFPALPALNPTSFVASQGVYNPATGLWDLASLGSGNSATLDLTFVAPNMAGPLTNQGSVAAAAALAAAANADPDTGNNTAEATVTVLSPAAVTARKSVSGTFNEGGTVTYSVVLSNGGTYDQQDNAGDEFTDVLPASLTLVSASASSGTALANLGTNTVTWNGAVPAGGSVTVTITATIDAGTAGTTISNQGSFASDSDGNGLANEAPGATDDPTLPGAADPTDFYVLSPASLAATKAVAGGAYQPGDTVTYTIVLTNNAAFAQTDNPGDEFVDVLPAGLALVAASATSGTAVANLGTNTVTWNGAIAAAASVTITIEATVTAPQGTIVANQGTVNFDSDGNATNDSTIQTDDPDVGGASDATLITVGSVLDIPTVGELGLLALLAALAAAGTLQLRRRQEG